MQKVEGSSPFIRFSRKLARFSCRVFAPVYRHLTLNGILPGAKVPAAALQTGYRDVPDAWRPYLRKDNRGRGVVLIGHSQGGFVLRRLIAEEIDPKAKERERLVPAVLARRQRPGAQGRRPRRGLPAPPGLPLARPAGLRDRVLDVQRDAAEPVAVRATVACAGGRPEGSFRPRGPLHEPRLAERRLGPHHADLPDRPLRAGTTIGLATGLTGFPRPKAPTSFLQADNAFSARCSRTGGANVLRLSGAGLLKPVPDATWGPHLTEANIALGDLNALVRTQARNYRKRVAG